MSSSAALPPSASLRLDKWLWYARFLKSRSLATALVSSGRLRLDGQIVAKSHQQVRPGQVLTFPLGPQIRIVRVVALAVRRGPAVEAHALYEDMTPPPEPEAAPGAGHRARGAGRPTKRDRRAIERLKEG